MIENTDQNNRKPKLNTSKTPTKKDNLLQPYKTDYASDSQNRKKGRPRSSVPIKLHAKEEISQPNLINHHAELKWLFKVIAVMIITDHFSLPILNGLICQTHIGKSQSS